MNPAACKQARHRPLHTSSLQHMASHSWAAVGTLGRQLMYKLKGSYYSFKINNHKKLNHSMEWDGRHYIYLILKASVYAAKAVWIQKIHLPGIKHLEPQQHVSILLKSVVTKFNIRSFVISKWITQALFMASFKTSLQLKINSSHINSSFSFFSLTEMYKCNKITNKILLDLNLRHFAPDVPAASWFTSLSICI